MIRAAEPKDIEPLLYLAKRAVKKTELGHITPDRRRAEKQLSDCILAPNCFTQVIEIDGKLVGALVAILMQGWWFKGDTVTDLFFYIDEDYRGRDGLTLLNNYIQWVKGFDSVKYIQFAISYKGEQAERTATLYEKLGFRLLGKQYVLEIGS